MATTSLRPPTQPVAMALTVIHSNINCSTGHCIIVICFTMMSPLFQLEWQKPCHTLHFVLTIADHYCALFISDVGCLVMKVPTCSPLTMSSMVSPCLRPLAITTAVSFCTASKAHFSCKYNPTHEIIIQITPFYELAGTPPPLALHLLPPHCTLPSILPSPLHLALHPSSPNSRLLPKLDIGFLFQVVGV